MANKGKHRDEPKPIFLKPDKVPTGKNWSTTLRDPSKYRLVKIRSIAFTGGISIRFYESRPRLVAEETRLKLRTAAKKKLRAVQSENLKATKSKLRMRFRGTKKKV